MTNRQPSWNILEAVVLLDAFIATKDGLLSRTEAVQKASSDLRKMALNQGTNIDQFFRNESGISFQMHSMESAFYGKTMFKPATKLFTEAARIYHEDQNEYQKLLKEARTMIDGKTTIIDDYMQYLAKKVPPSQFSEFFDCYSEIEAFCMKTKVLQKPLFETTDFEIIKKVQRTIEQNKIFRITHKRQFNKILTAFRYYYLYIKEGQFPRPETESEKNELIVSTPAAAPTHLEVTENQDNVEQLTRTEQDERLLQKYPIIYKRVYSTLKASDCALSIEIIGENISRIARPAVLEEILDNASWAASVGENYMFSAEIVDHSVAINEEEYVEQEPNLGNVVISYEKTDVMTNQNNESNSDKHISKAKNSTEIKTNTDSKTEMNINSYTMSSIRLAQKYVQNNKISGINLLSDDKSEVLRAIDALMADKVFTQHNREHQYRFSTAFRRLKEYLLESTLEVVPQDTKIDDANLQLENPTSLAAVVDESKLEQNVPTEYNAVLAQYFTKGFRMESALEIRKFRKYYYALHETELVDSDDKISMNIKDLCIIYDRKAFLPEVMLSEDLKNKLFEYIDAAFSEGKNAIYYQALYTEFAEAFLDHHIHDADMLKAYLTATGNGQFYIQRSFISKEPNVTMDPLSEIRECLIEYGRPVEYEELFEVLPHIPQSKIKNILASNGEFVNNGQGAYFHEKIVRLSDEELEGIVAIISQTINDKDFMGGNELYDAIKAKYSYIIEENKSLSVYGFRDALKAKLGNRFSFKGNVISHFGNELSMADVFAKYAQTHDSFTLSELQGLASNLATVIYFDIIYANSLRISKEQFVSKAMAQFAVSEIDDALDRICVGKYIPLCEVQNFGVFPYAGFTWNNYLLEHYVASYSQKYKLLHSGFNGTECAGAIVRRSAGIDSFDDLIVDILVNNPIELMKDPALQYLSNKGYLARRRYSEIEALIIKAKAQKQRKDK